MIGGNYPTGLRALKEKFSGVKRIEYYTMHNYCKLSPFCRSYGTSTLKIAKLYKTMKRNAMRGIKLNKKRGGISSAAISQFGQVKKTVVGEGVGTKGKGEQPKGAKKGKGMDGYNRNF